MQDWHLQIEEQGESGERVLLGMNHRLQRTLDEHADAGRWYDWVLLLGGINDIGGAHAMFPSLTSKVCAQI
jgi:lysophospholipase L1-like esterase